MTSFTKTYRLTVWNDFSVELVHGHEGSGIRVELDEAVGRLLAGELVSNELSEQKQMMHIWDLKNLNIFVFRFSIAYSYRRGHFSQKLVTATLLIPNT